MAVADNGIPLSVDYTGRDYYSLRAALIARVQNRVPAWQGSDPNDFGLALVEAFAYLGDSVNYYIDRAMNESHILTATQRESLLSLATTFGYRPANYVGASTDLQITSNLGYLGQVGAAVIEDGDSTHTLGNYCKIIVPTDHPFTSASSPATGKYNTIKVNSMPSSVSTVIDDQTVTYGTSAFNGTYSVVNVGYDSIGNNVVWYRPSSIVSGIAQYSYAVSSASSNGSTVTYVALNHQFQVGDIVTITGFTSTGYNLTNAVVAAVTSQYFTVASSVTSGTATGTGTAKSSNRFVISLSNSNQTLEAVSGQDIILHAVTATGNNWNGRWVVSGSATATGTTPATITVSTLDSKSKVVSAKVSGDGGRLVFASVNYVVPGEFISITGAATASWNVSNVAVSTTHHVDAAISRAVLGSGGTSVTFYVNKPFYRSKSVALSSFAIDGSNVVTFTFSSAHQFGTTGGTFTVSGVTGTYSYLNGTYTVASIPSTTSVTAAFTHATVSQTSVTGTAAYTLPLEFVSIRNIASVGNELSAADQAYNLSNVAISSTATTTSNITFATCASPGTGFITFQTAAAHSFLVGDYVTITGVANTTTSDVTDPGVLNLVGAKVTSVPSSTTFVVAGYWNVAFDAANSNSALATLHSFTVTGTSITGTTYGTTGYPIGDAYSEYFTVSLPNANTVSSFSITSNVATITTAAAHGILSGATVKLSNVLGTYSYLNGTYTVASVPTSTTLTVALTHGDVSSTSVSGAIASAWTGAASGTVPVYATPQVGGTWTSGGEVVYDYIPAVTVSGPYVNNVGYTVVPKGTQVNTQISTDSGTKTVVFSTQADVAVPFQGMETVLAVNGEDISLRTDNAADMTARPYDIAGELLGYSTGDADQVFALKEVEVDTTTVKVYVDTGAEWEEWTRVPYIQDYTPSSKVFQVTVQADGTVTVVFGNGVSGKIPTQDAGIKSVYIAGGGVIGNVSAGSLTTWDIIQGVDATTIRTSMTVTNPFAATGGADPESNDSIRYNAPRSLRSLNRAVTLEDFGNLALAIDGVVKANAVATTRSNVTVYIAPNSTGSSEPYPGISSETEAATPQMEQYKSLVANFLADKKQIGTTVTVLEPRYSDVSVAAQYSALPQYNESAVGTALKTALLDAFSYANNDFEDVITPEEVEFKLRQVDGVANVRVTSLYRGGGSGRNSLIGDPDEIFVFSESNLSFSSAHSESRISTISFAPINRVFDVSGNPTDTSTGSATFTPTLNGEVYSYTLSLPVNTNYVTVTATALDGTLATISANSNSLTWNAGANAYVGTIPISQYSSIATVVTAQDGVTTSVYKFKLVVATS